MIYKSRIERNITIEYNGGKTVSIVSEETAYGETQVSTVLVENVGALIQALHDVQRLKYDDW